MAPNAFDKAAWERACQDGNAPRYHFQGIAGCWFSFGDALCHDQAFMDWFVRQRVKELMSNFTPLRQAWTQFCYEHADDVHMQMHEKHDECLADYETEAFEDLVQNDVQREEWVRRMLIENIEKLYDEIKRDAAKPDCRWRHQHPPIGFYSRALDAPVHFDYVAGFCPRCAEPCTSDNLWESTSRRGEWGLECPHCAARDLIRALERNYGRAFGLVPFTGQRVADLRAA